MLVIVLIMGGKMLSRSKAALFHRGGRIASPGAGQMVLSSAIFSALIVIPAYAATTGIAEDDLAGRGVQIEQRFLQSGASIVTTVEGQTCAVSRRIEIESSRYVRADGQVLPFDRIIRSIGSSVQVVDGARADDRGIRIQAKYSLDEAKPMMLSVAEQRFDLSGMLEPSTDSFWITGAAAEAVKAAFANAALVTLQGNSRDTGNLVTDTVPSPDLAALASCVADLPSVSAAALENQISLQFTAKPTAATVATLEEMRTCGMKPTDQPLHLGRIQRTTGFFAQTDKVFVTFDDRGAVDQVYVPGIFDAELQGEDAGSAHISRAADGNVPSDRNLTRGCIGAQEIRVCHRVDSGGAHILQACPDLLPDTLADGGVAYGDPTQGDGSYTRLASLGNGGGTGGVLGGGATRGLLDIGRSGDDGGDRAIVTDPDDIDGDNSPSPIPVPAAGWLLIAALTGFFSLRRHVG